MFRLWAIEYKKNHIVCDTEVEVGGTDTRTHKVFKALDEVCVRFDLARPIWLETNINEFKRAGKTRFYSDSFIEEIDFDYLEIRILEEDMSF